MNYDRTDEPRGWHKYPPKNRRLRVHHQHEYRGNRTRAITKCVTIVPNNPVRIRHKEFKASLTDYIAVADRVGLNPANVAQLYRNRQNNGYDHTTTIDIQTNATFRGGDH